MTKEQTSRVQQLRDMALDELRPLHERLEATVERMTLLIEMLEKEDAEDE